MIHVMKLARVNNCLLGLIILINGYLIISPVLPQIAYWWQDNRQTPQSTQSLRNAVHGSTGARLPRENRLVVPGMHLDEEIFEGPDMNTLKHGPWRRPQTSTPDKGGNTVIVGHRYTYASPRGTFYYLDKIRLGDELAVYWQGKKYLYKTTDIAQVKADQISVEAPTSDNRLTLYTCTPLWLPKDRLVITALLEASS